MRGKNVTCAKKPKKKPSTAQNEKKNSVKHVVKPGNSISSSPKRNSTPTLLAKRSGQKMLVPEQNLHLFLRGQETCLRDSMNWISMPMTMKRYGQRLREVHRMQSR